MPKTPTNHRNTELTGKLRIGDDWNAITIIALSQSNPLKAVAEFVENSIDAHAQNITISRGKERGQPYLRISDDGVGITLDEEGRPNFRYVATHICDSLKRQMKAQGEKGIQGEFGIGLLSFWTVGQSLSLVSSGKDGKAYEMRMAKGDPNYTVVPHRRIIPHTGTTLTIRPLLPGIRQFSGEKLQWYLASELRDRIRTSRVNIRIVDRQARYEAKVEPREFQGSLLSGLPSVTTEFGDVYIELYLGAANPEQTVTLSRSGTRVVERLTDLDPLRAEPWNSGYLQGLIDAPFLNLTPGTRTGVIQDERFASLYNALRPLEDRLKEIIQQQRQAAEEETNRDTLKSIQRAFREAISALPSEEYDWFQVYGLEGHRLKRPDFAEENGQYGLPLDRRDAGGEGPELTVHEEPAKEFFEHPGPLHGVRVLPRSCTLAVNRSRTFRAQLRDRAGRTIQLVKDEILDATTQFAWRIVEGQGSLENATGEIVTLAAPEEPQLLRLLVTARQEAIETTGEALVTITDSLVPERPRADKQRGLPEYTFENKPGGLWRSRYDEGLNLITVNSGHRDFVYAARTKTLKLRYLCRLFAKELVLHNFQGCKPAELLERMLELTLYTEDNLR